jgi:hypothetical protein
MLNFVLRLLFQVDVPSVLRSWYCCHPCLFIESWSLPHLRRRHCCCYWWVRLFDCCLLWVSCCFPHLCWSLDHHVCFDIRVEICCMFCLVIWNFWILTFRAFCVIWGAIKSFWECVCCGMVVFRWRVTWNLLEALTVMFVKPWFVQFLLYMLDRLVYRRPWGLLCFSA